MHVCLMKCVCVCVDSKASFTRQRFHMKEHRFLCVLCVCLHGSDENDKKNAYGLRSGSFPKRDGNCLRVYAKNAKYWKRSCDYFARVRVRTYVRLRARTYAYILIFARAYVQLYSTNLDRWWACNRKYQEYGEDRGSSSRYVSWPGVNLPAKLSVVSTERCSVLSTKETSVSKRVIFKASKKR